MSRFFGILVGVILLAGIGVIAWYHLHGDFDAEPAPAAAPAPAASASPPPEPAPATAAELRVPDEASSSPALVLPPLAESDVAMRNELEALVGRAPIESFLIPLQIVRRWVAFIDSLDRDGVPLQRRPAKAVSGRPAVETGSDGRLQLGAANAQRYQSYIAVLQAIDAQKLVGFYFRYYPLFQQAYDELGYGDGAYFNTRLLEVIDHLLATPQVEGPIALVQPKVLYQFADPELESRSFGQKMLIRMGADNAAAVKAKLREIRAAIVARARPAAGPG
ncbi:DUF3014 domain-containing protein [Solimonas soli]|uniref:DUF3014 domain-containing protein n=1 Tax=Solimonas soli TaxID=413479 RepID=UPI0004814499|nr:DUF3014 domain-containing protein [Solimonas soli]